MLALCISANVRMLILVCVCVCVCVCARKCVFYVRLHLCMFGGQVGCMRPSRGLSGVLSQHPRIATASSYCHSILVLPQHPRIVTASSYCHSILVLPQHPRIAKPASLQRCKWQGCSRSHGHALRKQARMCWVRNRPRLLGSPHPLLIKTCFPLYHHNAPAPHLRAGTGQAACRVPPRCM